MQIKFDIHEESFSGTLLELLGNALLIGGCGVFVSAFGNKADFIMLALAGIALFLIGLSIRKIAARILSKYPTKEEKEAKARAQKSIREKASIKTANIKTKKDEE